MSQQHAWAMNMARAITDLIIKADVQRHEAQAHVQQDEKGREILGDHWHIFNNLSDAIESLRKARDGATSLAEAT